MALAEDIRIAAESLTLLVHQHVALARIELEDHGRQVGTALVSVIVALPLLVVGYAGLCVAASFGLTRWVSLTWAVLSVAVLNLGIGAALIGHAVRRMRALRPLERSLAEFDNTARLLHARPAGSSTP